jgi:YgiT-type zinc finger domain-containing protein
MICINCYESEYITGSTSQDVLINGKITTIVNLECEKCPNCGNMIYTHDQSLEFDKKRISLEFGSKPILTPHQLRLLRKIINSSLDEICETLQIGKNSYGRWERGEVDITPSMNMLVHGLIERIPVAKVSLIDSERIIAIERAKQLILIGRKSLGEFLRETLDQTKLSEHVVCHYVCVDKEYFERIKNNEINPEHVEPKVLANIYYFFNLTMDSLRELLDNTLSVFTMREEVSYVHSRKSTYDETASTTVRKSFNKVIEQILKKPSMTRQRRVSDAFMALVNQEINSRNKMIGETR